jgi:serine---pyruvate transaminase
MRRVWAASRVRSRGRRGAPGKRRRLHRAAATLGPVADRSKLLTPGPTSVPPEVLAALAEPVLHHRGPDFKEIFLETLDRLKQVYRTTNDVLVLTSSGTGAFESAIVNLHSAGDRIVIVSSGEFGERWQKLGAAFGLDVVPLRYGWGETPDPNEIGRALAESGARSYVIVHSETSTGVVCDLEAVLDACRPTGALSIVDAISSLGAVPLETDAWGADVVVTGSQKALMTPPGLAFVSVSERAWERAATATLPRFYFDWAKARKAQAKGSTATTPATSTVAALHAALGSLLADGIEVTYARHRALGRACRAGLSAIGLDLYSPSDDRSAVLTGALTPEGVDAGELRLALRRRHGIEIAGGHGDIADRLFRVGHIGHVTIADIEEAMDSITEELRAAGADVPLDVARAAARLAYDDAVALA